MMTNCHERMGNDREPPVRGWVKRTFVLGLMVSTMTLEMVAKATIIRSDRG